MGSELQRLDQLINQLLEVGRLDAIGQQTEPEDVDLGPLLERCARIAATHHQVDVDAVCIWKVEPVVIHARRMVLELIFGNVLDNAIKYGGDPPRVEVTVRKHHGRVITTIQDNGEGVPQEIRKKIFHLFFRGGSELERRQKGTGLGLYIARTLVRMLKGSITVRDRAEGTGSVFEIDLPDGRHGKNSDR